MTSPASLSLEDKQILQSLARRADRDAPWCRPMDLGATDASSHSSRLKKLVDKGLVQRERRNSICNVIMNSARGSYLYSITQAGREALLSK